ncbi:APC family permease [Streptacidiphilus sp. PB12-B1b]|uniref:APC family permease n=1 Tax=Streptacidiphilus sp. PB12-B1b TaxID=2705012 RepID=UPI0015FE20A9|nr:APC family permease [Streptacidiphilus sp. PB12-B1b]QMU78669.1 APC family permease [Streptacidiphilus sp. PB12-B1b]
MSKLTGLPKRILIGRALQNDRLGETLLPKRIALPVFASDALSSVAYAPEQIFLALSVAGISTIHYSWWVGGVVALVMLVVVASYRQNVHAYPSGGGDYEVATVNLGGNAGLTVAAALMVDYVLTVAVSTTSGVANLVSAVPSLHGHEVAISVTLVVLLMGMNLRGVRESGTAFAIPTYGFMIGILGLTGYAAIRHFGFGTNMHAASSGFHLVAEPGHSNLAGLAMVFLLLKTFSSGCAALTGVEAISNGVPAFRKPKSKNAATTLLMMAVMAVIMMMGIIWMGNLTGLKMAGSNSQLLGAPSGYQQKTALAQISQAVFSNFTPGFYFIAAVTGLILVLAANTAFNGFPVLGSILAQDRYLPRQLHTRGDRLAFSNGIIALAAVAIVFIIGYGANPDRLIQLYIIGVFVSFNMSQTGMIRHWTRLLKTETDPAVRRRMMRSRVINSIGLTCTACVLVVVLSTKFLAGAWMSCLLMVVFFILMKAIRKHYDRVSAELAAAEERPDEALLPSRVHSVVLVSKLHKPTLRALAYAQLSRSAKTSTLEALTVSVDQGDTAALRADWERRGIEIPLKVLDSPYREVTRPVVEYVRNLRRTSPRDVVTVYIPEYVVGHWYEHLLHNQSALRLKGRLLFTPGVMVTSVPWQLESSERRRKPVEWSAPGQIRRGSPNRLQNRDAHRAGRGVGQDSGQSTSQSTSQSSKDSNE